MSCNSNRTCSSAQTAAKADINTVNVVVKHVPDFSASREKVSEMETKYGRVSRQSWFKKS